MGPGIWRKMDMKFYNLNNAIYRSTVQVILNGSDTIFLTCHFQHYFQIIVLNFQIIVLKYDILYIGVSVFLDGNICGLG